MRRRVLLTGGSGFIGKSILSSTLVEKHEIVAPTHKDLDLVDEEAVRRFVGEGQFDVIVHAAAKPGHRATKDPIGIFYANTRAFFNLARTIDSVSQMIVLGSGAIYDNRFYHAQLREEECDAHIPLDEHGLSKYVVHKFMMHDARFTDLRLFGVFGKREEYSIRFISNMICKAIFDLPLTMHQNRRFSYLFVDDFPAILGHFIEEKPQYEAYNVVPDETFELQELAEMVRDVSGKSLSINVETAGLGLEYTGSNARLREEIPEVRFSGMRDAVEKLYRWYESSRDTIDKRLLMEDS